MAIFNPVHLSKSLVSVQMPYIYGMILFSRLFLSFSSMLDFLFGNYDDEIYAIDKKTQQQI